MWKVKLFQPFTSDYESLVQATFQKKQTNKHSSLRWIQAEQALDEIAGFGKNLTAFKDIAILANPLSLNLQILHLWVSKQALEKEVKELGRSRKNTHDLCGMLEYSGGGDSDCSYSIRHCSWIWVQQPGPACKDCNSNKPIHYYLWMHADLAPVTQYTSCTQ